MDGMIMVCVQDDTIGHILSIPQFEISEFDLRRDLLVGYL